MSSSGSTMVYHPKFKGLSPATVYDESLLGDIKWKKKFCNIDFLESFHIYDHLSALTDKVSLFSLNCLSS